jgi:sulfur-oxidizing protein SoxY
MHRRTLLQGAAGALALSLLPIPATALTPEAEAARAALLAGRSPQAGGLTLEAPETAENGAQVPLTIRVDSPMTEADHVQAIHILSSANPAAEIGTFRLTPRLARAEVFTRIRLAETQDILVLAELSDGRVLEAALRVAVGIGGCAT